MFLLDSPVVAIFAVAGQRAYNQRLYLLEDLMAAQSSQQAVKIFDVNLNILKEENVFFQLKAGGSFLFKKLTKVDRLPPSGMPVNFLLVGSVSQDLP